MNRTELIQQIFEVSNFNRYLEIGVQQGLNFLPIKASKKVAVDPYFHIPLRRKVKWLYKNPKNLSNQYYEEESDIFFSKRAEYLKRIKKFDVVFIDGLHTFRASLNDALNSLRHLNANGIIVMHDCYPPTEAAALPTENVPTQGDLVGVEGFDGTWCGDVWKTIVYLKKTMDLTLEIQVLNTDLGLGILLPKGEIPEDQLQIDEEIFREVDALNYRDMKPNADEILNLKGLSLVGELTREITERSLKK